MCGGNGERGGRDAACCSPPDITAPTRPSASTLEAVASQSRPWPHERPSNSAVMAAAAALSPSVQVMPGAAAKAQPERLPRRAAPAAMLRPAGRVQVCRPCRMSAFLERRLTLLNKAKGFDGTGAAPTVHARTRAVQPTPWLPSYWLASPRAAIWQSSSVRACTTPSSTLSSPLCPSPARTTWSPVSICMSGWSEPCALFVYP